MREEGAWFKKLDWTEEEQFANFGLNKQVNRTTNLSDLMQPPREQQTMQIKRSRNARNASILGALVEESHRHFETDFDQSKIRREITQKKSMFKHSIKVKEIFRNEDWLKKVIMGTHEEKSN